jgi:hypothetical protein
MKSKRLVVTLAATLAFCAQASLAQVIPSKTIVGKDSVVVQAGADYAAGGFHRKMLGDNYRDLWTASIKVPVLDLRTFAGGITPYKEGGGSRRNHCGSRRRTASNTFSARCTRQASFCLISTREP